MGVFSEMQFGFQKGVGYNEASVTILETINHMLKRGSKIFSCFLDVRKAFDSSEELLEEYHTYKDELESIYNYITEGIILRSKVDWYEHGENFSKYFLNPEKEVKPNLISGKL